MPIEVGTEICVFDQEQFHALDKHLMSIIFKVHNDFGRLFNERLFKEETATRCRQSGMCPVLREVPIRLTHGGFAKDYFIDLLINQGLMLEAKTVECLAPVHRNQTLNYLFLTGIHHARLVNLRTESIQHEFVSTRLNSELRSQFHLIDEEWTEPNPESAWLKTTIIEILQDWGAFLEVTLYHEAVVWLLGGEAVVCQPICVFSEGRKVGTQTVDLLKDETAFVLTSVTKSQDLMRWHQLRVLGTHELASPAMDQLQSPPN